MRILSVNVGKRRAVTIKHKLVDTGIYKTSATGPVRISRLGVEGDVLVEKRKMGLEHHAVYAYPYEHYAYWQEELGRPPFPMGQFGENLTVTGLLETEVRIGDVFRFGSAILQVAQPRIPCGKLDERMGTRFSRMFLTSRKVGFYFRVLQEGSVSRGDSIELLERDENSPTMEEFVRVTQYEYWDVVALRQLLQARDLMPAWREIIEEKLERAEGASGWHGLREFEVVRREEESADTVSLNLKCVRGRPLPPFHGGQFIQVVLGAFSAHQYRRVYALSGNPAELATYRITVRRLPAPQANLPDGVVSSYLADLTVGEHVMCAAPLGGLMQFQHNGKVDQLPVLISRGLGIAPTLSLLYELESLGAAEVLLFHDQSEDDPQGLWHEVDALLSRNPGFRLWRVSADSTKAAAIDAALIAGEVALAEADVHLSGPKRFCEELAASLKEAGLPATALAVQGFN